MTAGHLLRAREVAAVFGVTPRTLTNWERTGVLVPIRIRGQRYYPEAAVTALVGERKNLTPFQSVETSE